MMALVITVAQRKGGAGKTSLAAHLSVAWAGSAPMGALAHGGASRRVIALDLDPQASLAKWFEVRRAAGVAGGSLQVKAVPGWRLSGELLRVKREADIIVLDLPPGEDSSAPAAFRASDLVLVPLQLSPMDLWATAPTVELARRSGVRPLLVLNRVPARARLSDAVIAEAKSAAWPIATSSLGNRIQFAASLMQGRGITEAAPSSLAAAEIRLLAREVMATASATPQAA
jgi:chromosome partitioning protein